MMATTKHPIYRESFYRRQHKKYPSIEFIIDLVDTYVNVASAIDIGCGLALWLNLYHKKGANILGIDGHYVKLSQLEIPSEFFIPKDISQPINDIQEKYDLTISLEVAEHIHPSCVEIYMDNITRFSDVVLFSAAIPRQGGRYHVNEQ